MALLIDLRAFKGSNTKTSAKLLGDGIGVYAANIDPTADDFRGIRTPSTAHTLTGYGSQQQALYRMGRETASDTAYWLAFATDVDFARSMLASDPLERTYGTGGSFTKPAFTDNTQLVTPPYPNGGWDLGVPAPGSGMAAAVNVAGSGSNETRVYVATFSRGSPNLDQSAPSPSVSITCPSGSTVGLTGLPGAPAGGHAISLRQIYVSTGGDFLFCGEVASTATSFTDTGVRGAVLQTGGSTSKPAWLTPPDDMIGLIELWSGMHGGFTSKQFLTCVPFKPHAWPVEYRRTVPDRIVGTAKWGQNWLLATTGIPRVVTGTTPIAMADSPIYFRQACVSKRSVKSVGHGVCWASNAGLCYYGQKGPAVLTEGLMTRAEWRALQPETIIGANWGPWYFGFYNNGTRKGFMVNTDNPTGVIWLDQDAYAIYEDPISDALYLLTSSNTIKKWDYGGAGLATGTFKSKVYRRPAASSPSAARIVATTYPITFSLWVDGVLKVNARSVTSDDAFRLPDQCWGEEFQVQIVGAGPVEGVFVADDMADLP